MALQDLLDRLELWKTDEFYSGSKSYQYIESPIVPGEYYFKLRQKVKISMISPPIVLSSEKTFHTQTLSPEPMSDNIDGDIYRLNGLLPAFDEQFSASVEKEISIAIEKLNPQGFF
jgi:hypothetical protein